MKGMFQGISLEDAPRVSPHFFTLKTFTRYLIVLFEVLQLVKHTQFLSMCIFAQKIFKKFL